MLEDVNEQFRVDEQVGIAVLEVDQDRREPALYEGIHEGGHGGHHRISDRVAAPEFGPPEVAVAPWGGLAGQTEVDAFHKDEGAEGLRSIRQDVDLGGGQLSIDPGMVLVQL